MKAKVLTLDSADAGEIDLKDEIFGLEPRADLIQRVVVWQLAKRRSGQHQVQTRGEINRTKKKMYKQKGTGQARHGAANAPIFRGGGMAHAIHPRDYTHDLPKKVRAMALRHALSAKAGAKALIVVDAATLKDAKTGVLKAALAKLDVSNALLIAGGEVDANLARAARNIPNLDVLPNAGLNVYDVLRRDVLVLTKAAVEAINARFAGETSAKEAA